MKKKYTLIVALILLPCVVYAPHRHSINITPISVDKEIPKDIITSFYDKHYKIEYVQLQQVAHAFTIVMNNFIQQLTFFAQQPSAAQNATSIENVVAAFKTIKQKPLVIAITKLLQFKKSTSNENIAAADKLITQLNTIIQTVENTIATIHVSSQLQQEFNTKIANPLVLRLRKIKRAINNWGNN